MFRILVFALILCLGGCTIVHEELDNRGGYVDYLADKYWWKADSKKMRALRAYALHTAIARIAMISPKGASERDPLAYQIGAAGKYAQLLMVCAFGTPGEPCFYFDSIMVDYVTVLYGAAVASLPLDDAKKLINDITGGVVGPVAAVDALQALIRLGADAVRYGTVSAALYRDSLELEVQVWINSPNEPGSRVTAQDVAALKAIYDTGRDDIPAWKAEIERLVNAKLEPTPNPRYLARLFTLMTYACTQITPDANFQSSCIVDPMGKVSATATPPAGQPKQPGGTPGGQSKAPTNGPVDQAKKGTSPGSSDQQQASLTQKLVTVRQQVEDNKKLIGKKQDDIATLQKKIAGLDPMKPADKVVIDDLNRELANLDQDLTKLTKDGADLEQQSAKLTLQIKPKKP